MFMIVNRHKEILATDGEFYPAEAISITATAKLFPTEADAEHYQLIVREYTKVFPVESSL